MNIALIVVGVILMVCAVTIEERKLWYWVEVILGINMIMLGIYT